MSRTMIAARLGSFFCQHCSGDLADRYASALTDAEELKLLMKKLGEKLTSKEAHDMLRFGAADPRVRDDWVRVLRCACDCQAYVPLYKRQVGSERINARPLDPQTEGHVVTLMEWRLPLRQIMAFRDIADAEIKVEEEKIIEAEKAKPKSVVDSLFSMFGYKTEGEPDDALALTDEERKELLSTIETDEASMLLSLIHI